MSVSYARLNDLVNEIGENNVKILLSDFLCPWNSDVENFLHSKAIEFDKQGISQTFLLFMPFKGSAALVGYYSLASKIISLSKGKMSATFKKRLKKFATFNQDLQEHQLAVPLIGQLGKNFNHNYHNMIKGDYLLKHACDKVMEAQKIIGGRFVYLECENIPALIQFYESNGFREFGERTLTPAEIGTMQSKTLIQLIKGL